MVRKLLCYFSIHAYMYHKILLCFKLISWEYSMEEIILLLVVVLIAYIFRFNLLSNPLISKLTRNFFFSNSKALTKIIVPEDSILKRHFLTQLGTENALVALEIQKR